MGTDPSAIFRAIDLLALEPPSSGRRAIRQVAELVCQTFKFRAYSVQIFTTPDQVLTKGRGVSDIRIPSVERTTIRSASLESSCRPALEDFGTSLITRRDNFLSKSQEEDHFTAIRVSPDKLTTIVFSFVGQIDVMRYAEFQATRHAIQQQFLVLLRSCQTNSRRRAEEYIVESFFESRGASARKWWAAVVESLELFGPLWAPPTDIRKTEVELILPDVDMHEALRIVAATKLTSVNRILIRDQSITGLFFGEAHDYVYILPKQPERASRYRSFMFANDPAEVEFAVALRVGERLVGILNYEHPELKKFSLQTLNSFVTMARFAARYVDAVQGRFVDARQQERTTRTALTNNLRQIASAYSHLIQNPLKIAELKLDLALAHENLDGALSAELRDILEHVKRGRSDSLEFGMRLPRFLPRTSISVMTLLANLESRVEELVEKNEIIFVVDRSEAQCNVYASRLVEEHLRNILMNAIRKILDRRHQIMSSEIESPPEEPFKPSIRVSISQHRETDLRDRAIGLSRIQIIISDNGGGAPEALLKNLGRVRVESSTGGQGWALLGVRHYMNGIGGSADYANDGDGFRVILEFQGFSELRHINEVDQVSG